MDSVGEVWRNFYSTVGVLESSTASKRSLPALRMMQAYICSRDSTTVVLQLSCSSFEVTYVHTQEPRCRGKRHQRLAPDKGNAEDPAKSQHTTQDTLHCSWNIRPAGCDVPCREGCRLQRQPCPGYESSKKFEPTRPRPVDCEKKSDRSEADSAYCRRLNSTRPPMDRLFHY